jgi:outer membrane protein insertion porin family/translocation and assembly module TamA
MPSPCVLVRGAVLAVTLAAAAGCASIPQGRSAVDSVDVVGAHSIGSGDVTDRLATSASPKFIGLFRGLVYDYTIFDASVLQRDLARVERYYRGHGFFEAQARTARVIHKSDDHVRVEIVVDEGPPTVNRQVRIDGLEGLPGPIADEVRSAATGALPQGARFDEDVYARMPAALTSALTDRGYAYAGVQADAEVDLASHMIDYTFTVRPGIPAVFGPVTFVGLDPALKIDERQLRRTMHIRAGKPYSTAVIDSATQALLDLGVFSSVRVVPALPDPPADVVPLTVTLEPTKMRTIRLGVGAEFDELKTDVHGLAGWEDHDFFGGLRAFSIDFKPGVVLYPTRINDIVVPDQPMPEERLRLQLRQPGFIEPRTTFFVRPEINIYPLLVQTQPDPNGRVVGYIEPKGTVGVDRRFGRRFFATFGHNVQAEIPFTYRGQPDASLPTIVLSFPQLITKLDFRDNPLHPHAGLYVANDLQVAGGPFGGSANDVRVQPEVRGFLPLAPGVTLAARGSLGFLFPLNYGDHVKNNDLRINDIATNRDIELVYFRGFFSGGPSSNRGFPLRGIAPHGIVPFLSPATATGQVALNCDPSNGKTLPPSCSTPIGGFTLWEASAEVRFDVSGPFGAAVFCDAGDVSPQEVDFRPGFLHVSCGVGARYDTPVGPIRLDVGYRIQPLQVLGYPDETSAAIAHPTEGTQPTIVGVPIAVAFGIGEAF